MFSTSEDAIVDPPLTCLGIQDAKARNPKTCGVTVSAFQQFPCTSRWSAVRPLVRWSAVVVDTVRPPPWRTFGPKPRL